MKTLFSQIRDFDQNSDFSRSSICTSIHSLERPVFWLKLTCLREKRRWERKLRAFLLIEVMVALGIFALAVTLCTQSCLNALHASEVLSQKEPAMADFQQLYYRILNRLKKDSKSAHGERRSAHFGEASWTADYESTAILDVFEGIFSATFDLPGHDLPKTYEEPFTIFRPGWTPETQRRAKIDAFIAARNAGEDS